MNGRLCAVGVCILMMALMGPATPSWAIYGVRIADLHNTPVPTGKIRVWGKVTSESPLKLTDGRGEVTVTGRTATLGEYLVLDGWWNGQFFSVFESEMIYIPAGSFLMGNSNVGNDAVYHYSWELPQHWVYLSGYHIGKYEVTRGEYRAFMNAGGYSKSQYWSTAGWSWRLNASSSYPNVGPPRTQPSFWDAVQNWGTGNFTQTDSYPVVGVTYYEAEAFCNWAGGHLPTEAQWERAARWTGSHPNVYPWGDTWNQEYCNNYYDSNAAGGGYGKHQTAPVGSYSSHPSPSGCQDMAGNVGEWVQDWYKSYPNSTSPFDYTGSYRVLRGGDWYDYDVNYARCAYRDGNLPYGCSNYYFGFRLAR